MCDLTSRTRRMSCYGFASAMEQSILSVGIQNEELSKMITHELTTFSGSAIHVV
jgi:hypothetical protein